MAIPPAKRERLRLIGRRPSITRADPPLSGYEVAFVLGILVLLVAAATGWC